jgi:hypothetical protein
MANTKANFKRVITERNDFQLTGKSNGYFTEKSVIDSGFNGKTFEMEVKLYANAYKGHFVSRPSQIDLVKGKNRIAYEIKSGCCELGILDMNGEIIKSTIDNSQYVIYTPEYQNGLIPVEQYARVFQSWEFWQVLDNCGLVREKMSTGMTRAKKAGLPYYNDRLAIQSFKNSKTKTVMFLNELETHGILLRDFAQENW